VVPFYHDQTHFLRLPQEKVAVFTSNEDKIYAYAQYQKDKNEKPFMLAKANVVKDSVKANTTILAATKSLYHKVKKGDNLANVAEKYGVTIAEIKRWNRIKGNTIAYGRSLKINTDPTAAKELKFEPKNAVSKNTALAENKVNKDEKAVDASHTAISYVVQKGDNLGSIAKKHDVTIADIQKWNSLSTETVQKGVTLQVSPKETDVKQDAAASVLRKDVEYVVLKGDNLGAIATKFGATVPELKSWNNLPDNTITIGKSLIVAKDEIAINTDKATVDSFKTKKNTSAAKTASEYFVKKGDSLFSISKKYPGVTINDLKKWNGISGEDIKPGMKLKING
jgi:membrane-bound lytic murein transglycosylase D